MPAAIAKSSMRLDRGVWSTRLNVALDQLDKYLTSSKENPPEEPEPISNSSPAEAVLPFLM